MRRSARFAAVGFAALLLAAAVATAGERGAAPAPITLGLFLPAGGPLAPIGDEVARGAAIAVHRVNAGGGIDGRRIRLRTAASDRLWDGASDELVRLIFGEGAVAIIGALDGRAAHLAEQVVTRARGAALFITPWASETTLTRIRVPWFFRMVPDDRQQAEVLAREIFVTRGLRRVAVWVGGEFDDRSAAAAFRRASPAGAVQEFDAAAGDATGGMGDIDAGVLFAAPDVASAVIAALRATGTIPPLYGPLALTRPRFLEATAVAGATITLIAPAEVAAERFGFDRRYRQAHGRAPTLPALYGHDAAAALLEAVRAAGTVDGDRLAAALRGLSFDGVTGEMRFNGQGGREKMPALAAARTGTPVARCSGDDVTGR